MEVALLCAFQRRNTFKSHFFFISLLETRDYLVKPLPSMHDPLFRLICAIMCSSLYYGGTMSIAVSLHRVVLMVFATCSVFD